MITNNTYVNGNKPPKYYIDNHRVRSMYYNDNLIFHHVPCLQILLNAHELVLTLKGTFTLKTTLVPADCNEDIIFESTDENVAIIENGIIKPKALGDCVINVICGNITAKCKVAVKSETVMLYNKGVVNNDSEFGAIVCPSRVEFQTTQMFMNLVGASSDYSALWLSWSNRIEFSEYDSLNIHIENPNDHSTIIGLTRNTITGMQGYETGRVTAVDGDTFVGDRTITTLLKGTNDHSLYMDLVGGDTGFMGLYFKRKTDSNDSVDEHILINTIQVIRKDVYIVGSGEDMSEDFEIPCTGMMFKEDELLFSYLGDPITTNLANILDRTPGDTDEPVIWAIIEGDDTITLSDTGLLTINGKGFSSVQAICGKYFDDIRITSIIESTGVALNVYDLSFTALNTQQVLNATVIPADTTDPITWQSSNNKVATVNNGVVTSVGIGSCTITATCGSKSATCNVNVSVACTGISLNASIINFTTINGKESLVATVTPSNTTDTVTWKSSNTGIATVNNGVVTSVGIGSCTITATCGSKFATCNVNVSVACTALALDTTLIQFNAKGLTQVLTVTPSPANTTDTVTWKSSNTNIATVNNGVVTSVGDGTCTITATCGSKTAVCEVTVNSNRPCEQIALSKNSLSFDSLGSTKVLTAELTPSNTTDTVTWKSSNTAVATVNNGVVTSVGDGTCTITATCGSKSATCTITVDIDRPCTSLSVNPTSLTVNVGDFVAFGSDVYVSVQPSNCTDSLYYRSGNEDIMSGSIAASGVFQAYAPGTTTLTAYCGTKSASCTITVKSSSPTLELTSYESYMAPGETHTFYADLYNGDINKLIVNSSNPDYVSFTYTILSETRMGITVKMSENAAAGAINFNYESNLLARFEAYVRVD